MEEKRSKNIQILLDNNHDDNQEMGKSFSEVLIVNDIMQANSQNFEYR